MSSTRLCTVILESETLLSVADFSGHISSDTASMHFLTKSPSVKNKTRKNHRFMLDSKSCRHSWKWKGWFCCKRWPFSLCYSIKITSFWTTTTCNKADIWEMAKSWKKTVLTINFSQLILPLVFISTSVVTLTFDHLTLKVVLSHVWRGLPLCQFWSS